MTLQDKRLGGPLISARITPIKLIDSKVIDKSAASGRSTFSLTISRPQLVEDVLTGQQESEPQQICISPSLTLTRLSSPL